MYDQNQHVSSIRPLKINFERMKKISLFIICILTLSSVSYAQKIDSVRQVIRVMGYDLPRLSPVPESGKESKSKILSLNGTWRFYPDGNQTSPDQNIEVPGEWVMQGFSVNPGTFALYRRDFKIPSGWNDDHIKLRCDAIYSECEIFVNGKKAGGHLGGFTAFETDITSCIQKGKENTISIRVRSESIADSLSSASKYAVHPLGGISRKIWLLALPEVNCSMFHVSTKFDENYVNAKLNTEIELANESSHDLNTDLRFELSRDGDPVAILKKDVNDIGIIKANSISLKNFSFDIAQPLKWDPEHPNLYSLKLSVISGGKVIEVISRTFGFRQTEVRGNQVFVNNMPIKLRGVCRHEVMPLRGRSLSPGQWEEDVKLFRAANVNYIRTSHYPPAPEFLEACDRLGMFVEVEGPFCWAEQTKVPESLYYQALIQPELEMINTFRSNPSVLMWSIANESGKYKEYFSRSAELIKAIDPTHPRNFSQYNPNGDNGELEISNHHYPGPKGPEKYADAKRPVTFDEYCHLNAYNRFELVTDPGIRDAWGIGFERMWEKMYYAKGVLGGAIWAGIDDSFILPDGRAIGYGTWGPVDGWRRPKPEYWHVKKVYSPVKIRQVGNQDAKEGLINFEIENRMLFTNLAECKFMWKANEQASDFQVNAKPGEIVQVALKIPHTGKVYLEVTDHRGVTIDQYEFIAVPLLVEPKENRVEKLTRTEENSRIRISSGNIAMIIDKTNNDLKEIQMDGKVLILNDARLMILPLNGKGNGTQMKGDNAKFDPFTSSCKNRIVQRIEQAFPGQGFSLKVYDISDDAKGYTEYLLSDGELNINYKYEIRKDINPRQVGLVFSLPESFQQLEWERTGQWNFYPQDHIGRLKGTAVARNENPLSGPAGPVAMPSRSWTYDQNELGTNDFRSTKMNITTAILSDGLNKVNVISDGSQHIRCWLENGSTRMLVASYSNMGAEGFFRSHAELIDHPLKPGDYISGTVHLTFSR
jgi:beta-galactosidase